MAQSTENQPILTPIGGLKFGLHLGTNYGQSTASLVIEALQIHRDSMLRLMFEQIREGEYQNAHVYYECFTDLQDNLDILLNEALAVADHNRTAFDYKANPSAYRKALDQLDTDKAERYDLFLKKILSSYPEQQESE